MRCQSCRNRFETSIWEGSTWKYARCPRCLRFELSTWSEQYYNPPNWTLFLLRMGGTPYRCERCRCNFVSFRACKERYRWRQPEAPESVETPMASGQAADPK